MTSGPMDRIGEQRRQPAAGGNESHRVLVIDDEPLVRTMLTQMLERAGYEVATATNGRDGLQSFDEAPAAVVITDLIMPEQGGLETIGALRRGHPETRIIAVSGGARIHETDLLGLASTLGADRILAKPMERQELLDAVAACLASER